MLLICVGQYHVSYFEWCKAFATVSAGSSLEIMRSLLSYGEKSRLV